MDPRFRRDALRALVTGPRIVIAVLILAFVGLLAFLLWAFPA
jgi:hypothetical protein